MIELSLDIKIYLDNFPGRLKLAEIGKSTGLKFLGQVPKVVGVMYTIILKSSCSAHIYLQTHRTYLPLFQNMSVKIYPNFFLTFSLTLIKTNYLKDKMRHGM